MGEQTYKVRDPQGNMLEIKGPEGASDDEVISQAQKLFSSTPGGAAVGNPNLMAQGDKSLRTSGGLSPLTDIAGAGAAGGALGAFSSEILTGLGKAARATPQTMRIAPFLESAGSVLKAGGRTTPAIAGAISGTAGETAGQLAEVAGAGPVAAEGARIIGGVAGAETAQLSKWIAEKYVTKPALSLGSHIKKLMAKTVLQKMDGAESLSAAELRFVEEEISALRGAPKTDAPLEGVGSIMGEEGRRVLGAADQQMIAALQQASDAKLPATQVQSADIGGSLRDTIVKRNEAALKVRAGQYKSNETLRDQIVSARENAGQFIDQTPEYTAIVDSLKAQLDNTDTMKRSPDVQRSIKKVMDELTPPKPKAGGEAFPGLDVMQDAPETKSVAVSFQAIDDVRRKLGEVFKGKPAEGYEALNDARGRELYARLTDLQKKFAGGDGGPHAKLLEDYHSQSEALGQFRTKLGKKATALDQFQEGTFATDASTLPATYFKTRASVRELKELTGSAAQVNHAALEHANQQLVGKDAAAVRSWLGKNTDWITETPAVRHLVEKYATRLEAAERSLRNANDFVAQAAKDSSMLTRNSLPAQRAVDLIKSGDTELWAKITPVIIQSPQAKSQMVSAVRQVVADQATAKATSDLFSRNIRPFIETSGIGTKAEMDFISQRLANIQEMKLPEAEKLGIAKRLILQSTGGWAATAASRTGDTTYQWAREKVVPE